MICQDFPPAPPLRDFVKCYHLRHFVVSQAEKLPFKPYAPRPEQTLAFYPRGFESVEYVSSGIILQRPRSVIIGQPTERTNRHLAGSEFIVLLVNFQPGALYRLTGIPSHELNDSFVDAEAVFSSAISQVNARLNSTGDYLEMIAIVEAFLIDLVKNNRHESHPLDQVTDLLVRQPENARVLRLAEASFLSTRQFERRFRQRTGVSPKLFARISRLNKSVRMKYNRPDLDWLTIALQCGYNDYQHLAKDYKDLAGVLPTTYFLEETKAPETQFGMRDSSL
ncbi:helix-turn-helix domain-containing protein [Dyadobacter sp. CY323]|uniref:helix-turn-helix domain-containing protein n=1 Tax=Dyadobacter sp. CY323 TaxID=2907302 RepID=UPI001F44B237|nr:helix-turn-helix domain-containing protein [Dyadobacter sp. CY323]MCE6991033.1 AraC family transcriptional regulator [Dyadobacter sp. CY323]